MNILSFLRHHHLWPACHHENRPDNIAIVVDAKNIGRKRCLECGDLGEPFAVTPPADTLR